ncbi:MAG: MBL fold metallo-hydrolase [Syntrophobacterales bacterium]|nr:MBL fold metallo-hydrolase [Syntrophobacterales bacterium]
MKPEELVKNVVWFGHDAICIKGSQRVFFDPYELPGSAPKADIILISHEHFDHCSPQDVEKIKKPDTIIITDKMSAKKLSGDVRTVKPGDKLTVKGVTVEVYPAYNVNKQFHPASAGMLSFVVEMDGVRYYHAGDTDFIPEMKNLKVDVAFLPVSGTYVMTAEEAVEAARAIKPKIAVPMHYGAIVGSLRDAQNFAKALEGEVPVVILNKAG